MRCDWGSVGQIVGQMSILLRRATLCSSPHARAVAVCPRLARGLSSKKDTTKPPKPDTPKFGKQVAGDEVSAPRSREKGRSLSDFSPLNYCAHACYHFSFRALIQDAMGQAMHDATKGRYQFLGDFVASMNKGPVKVDFSKNSPAVSEKQRRIDELNSKNLVLVQRSLVIGTLLVAFGGVAGWKLTKMYYGVKDVNEFAEVMHERMPKVSGKLEDSALGRKLQEASLQSRDAISEDKHLTDWRRSLRGKFNSPEGAELARQNSAVLAKGREQERISRKSKAPTTSTVATPTPTPEEAAAVAAYVAVAEGGDEKAAELAAAKALIEAAEAEGADAKEPLLVRTTTRVAQGAQQPAPEPIGPPLRPFISVASVTSAPEPLARRHRPAASTSPSLTFSHHLSPSLTVSLRRVRSMCRRRSGPPLPQGFAIRLEPSADADGRRVSLEVSRCPRQQDEAHRVGLDGRLQLGRSGRRTDQGRR